MQACSSLHLQVLILLGLWKSAPAGKKMQFPCTSPVIICSAYTLNFFIWWPHLQRGMHALLNYPFQKGQRNTSTTYILIEIDKYSFRWLWPCIMHICIYTSCSCRLLNCMPYNRMLLLHTLHLLSVSLRPARKYFCMFSWGEGYVSINEVGLCQFSTLPPPSFTRIY